MSPRRTKYVPVAGSVARLAQIQKENPKATITIRVYPGSGHGIAARRPVAESVM